MAAVLAVGLGSGAVRAATKTWTGLGADANWSTGANWSAAPVAGDDLVFPVGASRLVNNNDLVAGTSFNSLAFTGPVGGYTLNGNAIQLVAGVAAANSSANLVYLPITLAASQTFSATGDRLQFWGALALGANNLTLQTTTFPSVIELRGGISGSGGITASGSGFVFISDVPGTYTGATTVTGGLLSIVGTSLATASAVTATGGSFQVLNGGSVGPVTIAAGAYMLCSNGGISQIGNVTDLTLQAGSFLQMGMYSASNFGHLNASGNVTLTGANLLVDWFFTSSAGQSFILIDKASAGAITGTFAGLPEGATLTGNGRTYRISYVGGNGNDVVLTDVTAIESIPTLGSAGFLALGLLLASVAIVLLRRARPAA